MVEKSGLVLDIVVLLDKDLVFYCLDVMWVGDNGILVVLLLRVLFNGIF